MSSLPAALLDSFARLDDGRNWQKICAAEDWSHPLFAHTLANALGRPPSYHRKQWEFVVILITLMRAGALRPDARGVSFGAGREPILYVIARHVEHLMATDLYQADTNWATARTKQEQSPDEAVLGAAPAGFDGSRLSAQHMDMRDLDFPDQHFDFAYSSCAFEHIGKRADFIQHLKEVRRVLKPDGVYVMTTEFVFGNRSFPVKGNFKFCAEDLNELVKQGGLAAAPILDCGLSPSALNRPRPPLAALGVPRSIERHAPAVILQKDGVPYTSCALVLKPAETARDFHWSEREETSRRLQRWIGVGIREAFRRPCALAPNVALGSRTWQTLSDHARFLVPSGKRGGRPPFIRTEFLPLPPGRGRFRVRCDVQSRPRRLRLRVVARKPILLWNARTVTSVLVKGKQWSENIVVDFDVEAGWVYALVGRASNPGTGAPGVSVELQVAEP